MARLVASALVAVLFGMTVATAAHASPNIQTITRKTPTSEHTDADTLTWLLTFTEAVTEVDRTAGRDRHGNTPAQATPVRLRATAPWRSSTPGEINTFRDRDYFRLSVPHAGILVVETSGTTDTVGTVWQAGDELGTATDGGPRRNFRLSVPVAAGPVVIAVTGNRGRTGRYSLRTRLLVGVLENPAPRSFQSGIGVISGWVCAAEVVEIELNGQRQPAAIGTARADTAPTCGHSATGFGLLFNWNLLGDGEHTVVAFVDDIELARATVTVTTLGAEVVDDAEGTCEVADFPSVGESVTVAWQASSQNFVITEGTAPTAATQAGRPGVGMLENPRANAYQSGIGLISGWVCDAERVEIVFNAGPPQAAGYGTARADTQEVCGDADNGFGLLFNWNLLGDGEHTVVALVDGAELGRAVVRVTTLGEEVVEDAEGTCVVEDFPREGATVRLRWQPSRQNFGIVAHEREDPFARWNALEPQAWWRESAPYSCVQPEKPASVWREAGLVDLGGADPLSLIRYFGNGSYLRYGHLGFWGCTPLRAYPDAYHLDPPVDPAYYARGDLTIRVDIARVPPDATGWFEDDGTRVAFSMTEAVALLNEYVAAYFRRVSQDRLRITFSAGNEFTVPGDGSPSASENEQYRLVGACLNGCEHGAPGGLNRMLLNDVAADTAGRAYNGWAGFGLASLREGNMELIVHEMGHGWMAWPHSYAEVGWRAKAGDEVEPPNPYTNFYDLMSQLDLQPLLGWDHGLPSPLAINRYAAGWIRPEDVAVHLTPDATYTLSAPRKPGDQFLVVHSGRRHAFTTLEVLEERPERFRVQRADVYDPEAPGGRRARRYDGVLVSRYDQSAGTGTQARFGPALYRRDNPDYLADVGWGRDDYSLVADGETRDIGGGVRVRVAKNADGSWDVTVRGGVVAAFERWCAPIWFSGTEYDTGCFLDEAEWE